MMLSTFNDSVGSYTVFNYLVFLWGGRIIYQLVYFSSFGVLVQIIIKMLINSIKFLLIWFIFIILFAIVANVSYYDISSYSSFYDSFVSMYSSALGGFDFSAFDSSTHISYYSKKLLLAAYLLITVVMLMNFLIAILSDTYSFYLTQTKSLQMKEIIKLRNIYDQNPYYSCLVKAPILLNAYIILLAPFVLIFKSKKLNKAILFLEHLIVVILFFFGLIIASVLLYIPVLILLMMVKLSNIHFYSYRPIDYLVRIVDFFAVMLISPFILWILAIPHIVGETLNLLKIYILIKNIRFLQIWLIPECVK